MKSILAVLLISVATCVVFAQKTSREATYALRGPVREFRTEVATISKRNGEYVEGPRLVSIRATFDEDGCRPELYLYDQQGSLTRRIVTKFENGREVEFLNYDGAGNMWLRGVYLRDAEGHVRAEETYNGDGSLRSKSILLRNPAGQVVERSEYGPKEVLLDRLKNSYDDKGELKTTERTSYRPDGSLSQQQFTNITEKRGETLGFNPNGSLAWRSVRVNQEITDYGADGSLRKKTVIREPDRSAAESTFEPDGTITNAGPVADEIDSHGNWVKQTRWVTDAQGHRPVSVAYRTISYF